MGSGRVPAAGVIILVSDALERRGLVDGYARAAMLVLMVGIRRVYGGTKRRETVKLPRSSQRGGFRLRSGQIISGRLFQGAGRRHLLRAESEWGEGAGSEDVGLYAR